MDGGFYLGAGEPAFARPHVPDGPPRGAVLLVPPFGWEEVCAYRGLRTWAEALRAAGRLVLRIDLPGTGDAAGVPRDPDRLGAWSRAIADGAAWLVASAPGARLAAIGLGLPGLVLAREVLAGLDVDDLVLWNVDGRGRRVVRTLAAFARLEEADAASADADGGGVLAGGYLLAAETAGALEAVRLEPVPGRGDGRRALLLGREGDSVDETLRAAVAGSGFAVDEQPGPGWAAMTDEPHVARPPEATIAAVAAWLGEDPAGGVAGPAPPVSAALDLGAVVESPFTVPVPAGRLRGILARPAGEDDDVAILFLNAAAIRRSGPNRLWVELSRRLAADGIPCARIDIEGIGDGDGDGGSLPAPHRFYEPRLLDQLRAAVDRLLADTGVTRVLAVGLCSGGYHALHLALTHPAVQGAAMLNAGAIEWRDELMDEREARRLRARARRGFSTKRGRRVPVRRIVRAGLRVARPRPSPARRTRRAATRAFDRLRAADKRLLMAFGAHEPTHDELVLAGVVAQLDRWPNVALTSLPTAVHTLRPAHAQLAATALVEEFAAAERARGYAPRLAARSPT